MNSREIFRANQIRGWRGRKGVSLQRASMEMGISELIIARYELEQFIRVPCYDLYKMAKYYGISDTEFMDTVNSELEQFRRKAW